MSEVPEELATLGIDRVAVTRLEPSDVIVLMTEEHLNDEAYEALQATVRQGFGSDRKVIVLEGGLTLGVLRQGGEEA